MSGRTLQLKGHLGVSGDTFLGGGLGVSGDTYIAGPLSADTMSGRTLTLKENLGVSGRTFLGTLDAAGAGYSNDKILVAQSTGEVEYLTAAQLGSGGFWSADTASQPADYIRVSGTNTNVMVGSNLEVSGIVRTNIISNGNYESPITIMPDDSIKSIRFGYSTQQGAGTSYSFLNLELASPTATDTLFQLVQSGDLVFKGTGHELFRLDQGLNQASAYTMTAANGLGVSGDTEVAGTLSGRTISGRTLTLKENLGVSGNTYIDGDVYLPNTSKVIFNSPTQNDVWIEGANNQMTLECDNICLIKVDSSAEIKGTAGGFPFTLDAGGTDIYTFNVDSTPQLDVTGQLVISAQTITTQSVPTSLADDTGSGEIVTFGSNTSGMVAGKLYYLDAAGAWVLTDADDVADGGSQLLGIALDAAASDGVLLRGFFDVATYLGPGTFNQGVPVYVSTDVGKIAITQPSTSTQFVRVVGYCTDTTNVIYFNPDGTYITVA